jgi:polyphosphate kinase
VEERLKKPQSIFRTIRSRDIFFHHPYDSYEPIIRFINEAADDDKVLSIKQTLYRVSGNSPFIAALVRAAQKGKQVTVLVEVRARFDEKSNIAWAQALDKAGVQVLYGFPQWKTHSKISLVVRREETGIRRYLHLGTGNYNDATAKGYTDLSILTCNEQFAKDGGSFFNLLAGYPEELPMLELIASPYSFRQLLEEKIAIEKENALNGRPAFIVGKMNQLSDPGIVALLLDAAEAGVKIDLVVRGLCCLKVPASGNIRIRSIVGRFLEHARIFVFYNGGAIDTYISSADWMTRNIDRRGELTVPVYDSNVKERILSILAIQLNEKARAFDMMPDGRYTLQEGFDTQGVFMLEGNEVVDFSSLFLYDNPTAQSEE